MFSVICSQYRYVDETMKHVQAIKKNFPTLKLTRKDFGEQYKEFINNSENFNSIFWLIVHKNGAKEELACLCGTIPVHIKGLFMKLTVASFVTLVQSSYHVNCNSHKFTETPIL